MSSWTVIHNSHDVSFRSPFGAVVCLQPVVLRIKVAEDSIVTACILRLWEDGCGERLMPMQLGSSQWFEIEFIPQHSGIIWYYFILEGEGQRKYYGNNNERLGGSGKVTDQPPDSYQLTVYEFAPVPQWYRQGIMYQIFVDRFHHAGESDRETCPPGALLHSHWDDTPAYTKDIQTGEMIAYDFFGGNLQGIMEKLPYLRSLGVTIIYLNPIFEAASNHKYDTGNYHKIDAMFGTNELFQQLCAAAQLQGMAIILDGVFSHTGSDSVYFNKEGRYSSVGAYQSMKSPYYDWYRFQQFPDKYESWWGVDTLPNVDEMQPSYREFIITAEHSVIRHWLKLGAKGWRLDVVDELPAPFVKELRRAVKETDSEAVVIGEVWEDASNKLSYGERREYLLGQELDSTMNYPFRHLALDFVLGSSSAELTHRRVMSLFENYPAEYFYSAMNLIGSHDVPRVLSVLGDDNYTGAEPIGTLGRRRLTDQQRVRAKARLKLLVLWQMTFPGVPCIYYGDEAGMEGYQDPLNRRTYPWGKEDQELLDWYYRMTALRQKYNVFTVGDFSSVAVETSVYAFVRRTADAQALVILNRSDEWLTVTVDSAWAKGQVRDILGAEPVLLDEAEQFVLTLRPYAGKVLMACPEHNGDEDRARRAGVLLHPTSLPSPDKLGAIDKSAYEFVDFLAAAGQSLWQVLPLNPVGFGQSPYQCPSAFAGNPLLIDLTRLSDDSFLDFASQPERYEAAQIWKEAELRQLFARRGDAWQDERYELFCVQQHFWLADYCLFMALSLQYGPSWSEWPRKIRQRDPAALHQATCELKSEINYQAFLQYVFFDQWQELRRYAAQNGIALVGDMPLYVAYNSSDVWSRPELFDLDKDGQPSSVAGVPPDYFSPTGQLWGNPLYAWEEHAAENYEWWRERVATLLSLVDTIRLDHFRGLEAYYAIPANAATAEFGKWVKGPGADLLAALQHNFNSLPLLAEDLGYITPEVRALKDQFDLPGMQVLHFSFYDTPLGYASIATPEAAFVYTGTHDNNTTRGWYRQTMRGQTGESCLTCYLGPVSEQNIVAKLIEFAYASNGRTVIIPVQDLLDLDEKYRMNMPGTVGGNWRYRLEPGQLNEKIAAGLAKLTAKYRRKSLKNSSC